MGITLPIKRNQSGYFSQSYFIADQIKSNLTNLILTEPGERMMQPEFGCRLHRLLFEQFDGDLSSKVRDIIESAMSQWLPFVGLSDVEVSKNDENGTIYVNINYFMINSPTVTDSILISF